MNCHGALDDTYIKVNVSVVDRPRYRTQKDEVETNVLDICDTKGDFVFILPGWEGSVADSRANVIIYRSGVVSGNAFETPKEFFNMKHSSAQNVMTYAEEFDDEDGGDSIHATTNGDDITYIEASNEWAQWRDALVSSMFNE
ncbi:putative nuclease HARBI1 [Cucumis melo var. makuwa]|uniref:Putative nuclease HARBI1 n=1 Tax=Cucumis melo var. makuwa TaxID=1194695 RepID=A0A5D3C3K4_CUCMM|nr:putative nuclease HARBI1 [Cucumis melo var. makuwa]